VRGRARAGVISLALALVVGACGSAPPTAPPGSTTAPGSSPGPSRGSTISDGTVRPIAIPDPAAGLDGLPAYRATLTIGFSGTQAGAPSAWTQAYTLTVARASRTRVLEYAQTGLGDVTAHPTMEATVGDAYYLRNAAGEPCAAGMTGTGTDATTLTEPARLLPKVRTMTATGNQQVAGMEATRSTFDAAAVITGTEAQAEGTVDVATGSGLVLAYDLSLAGGHDVFDADTEGTMSWAYALQPLDTSAAGLPADCPAPLPDVPLTADAANVVSFPGLVTYETKQAPPAVADFYIGAMPAAGFSAVGDTWVGPMGATMGWSKGGQAVQVVVAIGVPTTVSVTPRAATDAPNPSPKPQPTTAAVAGQMRVVNAPTLLLGNDATPTALGSFHLAYNAVSPAWNEKVVVTRTALTADVQGADVHFTSKDTTGGKTTTSEGYKVAGKDYEVTKGKVSEGGGFATMAWLTWPLDVVVALGIGSFRTAQAGSEAVDGRPAEVYRLTGTVKDDTTGMFASFGFPITAVDGTVWVDAATGALLKADIGYTAELKDTDQKVRATTKGSFTLDVSRTGRTTVRLP
jgi:hypothetical protein